MVGSVSQIRRSVGVLLDGNRGRERKAKIPYVLQRVLFPHVAGRALTADYGLLHAPLNV